MKEQRRPCRRRVARMVAGLILLTVALFGAAARAQGPMGAKRGQSLQLAGIIEPASCAVAPCLGILKIQIDRTVRSLGVTMAQTETDEGMDIFNGFAFQSGQPLRLLAPKAIARPFLDAAPGTLVKMWGMLEGLNLIVADLSVEPTPKPTS